MNKKIKEIAKFIYEATRIEAEWSNRSIVPEIWKQRDDKFKKQFVNIIEMYLEKDKLPTPEKAHDSWVVAYEKMGWKYGEKRDVDKKTHPDMLPFNELPKDEKDKDSIFLTFVWLAKQFQFLPTQQHTKDIEKFRERIKSGCTRSWRMEGTPDSVWVVMKDILDAYSYQNSINYENK